MKDFLKTVFSEGPIWILLFLLAAVLVAMGAGRLRYESGEVRVVVAATPAPARATPRGAWMWDQQRKTPLDAPARPVGQPAKSY